MSDRHTMEKYHYKSTKESWDLARYVRDDMQHHNRCGSSGREGSASVHLSMVHDTWGDHKSEGTRLCVDGVISCR